MADWLHRWWLRLKPEQPAVGPAEQVRTAAAAAAALLLTVWLSAMLLDSPVLVVASVGASAIMLFALHASPLAQPWPLVGGYLVCALAGVAAARWIPWLPAAAAAAVALALVAMLSLRCLHPPGGAVALSPVLGGESVRAMGFDYVLAPVLANALLLLAMALLFNNLIRGRHYPRPLPATPAHPVEPTSAAYLGLRHDDLRSALEEYGRASYISSEDLDEIIDRAESHAYRRRFGELLCRDIMSADVVTVTPETTLLEAWQLMRRHRITSLAVVDRLGRAVGTVTLEDFVRSARVKTPAGLRRRLVALLRHHMGRDHAVGAIMRKPHHVARPDTHVAALVPVLTRAAHAVAITDIEGRLLGIVTQSDVISALYHGRLAEASPG